MNNNSLLRNATYNDILNRLGPTFSHSPSIANNNNNSSINNNNKLANNQPSSRLEAIVSASVSVTETVMNNTNNTFNNSDNSNNNNNNISNSMTIISPIESDLGLNANNAISIDVNESSSKKAVVNVAKVSTNDNNNSNINSNNNNDLMLARGGRSYLQPPILLGPIINNTIPSTNNMDNINDNNQQPLIQPFTIRSHRNQAIYTASTSFQRYYDLNQKGKQLRLEHEKLLVKLQYKKKILNNICDDLFENGGSVASSSNVINNSNNNSKNYITSTNNNFKNNNNNNNTQLIQNRMEQERIIASFERLLETQKKDIHKIDNETNRAKSILTFILNEALGVLFESSNGNNNGGSTLRNNSTVIEVNKDTRKGMGMESFLDPSSSNNSNNSNNNMSLLRHLNQRQYLISNKNSSRSIRQEFTRKIPSSLTLLGDTINNNTNNNASSIIKKIIKKKCSLAVTINCHLGYPVYCINFDKTGRFVVTGSDDFLARIFKLADNSTRGCGGNNSSSSNGGHNNNNNNSNNNNVLRGAILVCTLRGHNSVVADIAISEDNSMIATASDDGDVRIWGMNDGSPIAVLRSHLGGANMVRYILLFVC